MNLVHSRIIKNVTINLIKSWLCQNYFSIVICNLLRFIAYQICYVISLVWCYLNSQKKIIKYFFISFTQNSFIIFWITHFKPPTKTLFIFFCLLNCKCNIFKTIWTIKIILYYCSFLKIFLHLNFSKILNLTRSNNSFICIFYFQSTSNIIVDFSFDSGCHIKILFNSIIKNKGLFIFEEFNKQ